MAVIVNYMFEMCFQLSTFYRQGPQTSWGLWYLTPNSISTRLGALITR